METRATEVKLEHTWRTTLPCERGFVTTIVSRRGSTGHQNGCGSTGLQDLQDFQNGSGSLKRVGQLPQETVHSQQRLEKNFMGYVTGLKGSAVRRKRLYIQFYSVL